MLKGPKDCLNLHGSIFVRYFDNSEKNQLEIVLAVSEILRLFANILTPDDKYFLSVKASV